MKYNRHSRDERSFLLYCVRNGVHYDNCRFSMRFVRHEGEGVVSSSFDVFFRGKHSHPLGPVAPNAGAHIPFFDGAAVPRPLGTGQNAQARRRKKEKELAEQRVWDLLQK